MSIKRPQNRELCAKCDRFHLNITTIESTDELFFLGFFETIGRRSKNCTLCRIVYNFLTKSGSSAAFLHHQIVLSPRFGVAEFAILCPGIYQSAPFGWVRIIHANERIPINDRRDAGKIDNALKTGQIQYKQVRSWLASCRVAGYHLGTDGNKPWGMFSPRKVHNHPEGKETLVERSLDPRNMLLIDVIDENLVKGCLDVNFVALSYVWGSWGGLEVIKTTAESMDSLCQKGGLRGFGEKLPRVLSDAMEFVRGIGQRYLWCDLLCVVSDDPEVRDKQIQMMDAIYSEATLTIIALTGSHGNMELPGIRPRSRDPICLSETLDDGSRFVVRHVQLTSFYNDATYTKRAWTFQEELLSRRCLYFTDRQMYFKCRFCCHREDEVLFNEVNNENIDLRLNSFPAGHSSLTNVDQDFGLYERLLGEYSRRQLTFDKDILRALEGVTSVLAREYKCQFWHGLPSKFFVHALLWTPKDHISRRFDGCQQENLDNDGRLVPTWSWAAWKGPVSHLSHDPDSYFFPVIRGFLLDNQFFGTINEDLTYLFFQQVLQILASFKYNGSMDDFEHQFRHSRLNTGGWSTQSPTEHEAMLATEFAQMSPKGLENYFSEIWSTDGTTPALWPFGAIQCLNPDHIGNWWPSDWAIPEWEEIIQNLPYYMPFDEHDAAMKPLNEFRSGLFFPAWIRPFRFYNIDGGQLVEQNKGTLSTVLSTSNGTHDFDATMLKFSERKEPLDKRLDLSSRPITALFSHKSGVNAAVGVLYDFENDIKSRKGSSYLCDFISISESNSGVHNVMLVKQVGDGYERIAVGQLFDESISTKITKRWIRLN